MPKYTVKSPVKHDGKRYGIGTSITLKAEEAERLLQNGTVEDDRDSAADRKSEAARKAAEEAAAAAKAEADRKAAEEAQAASAAASGAAGQQP